MARNQHVEIGVHDLLALLEELESEHKGKAYFVMCRHVVGGKAFLWIDMMHGDGAVRFNGARFSSLVGRWPNWASKTFTGCLYRLTLELYKHLDEIKGKPKA